MLGYDAAALAQANIDPKGLAPVLKQASTVQKATARRLLEFPRGLLALELLTAAELAAWMTLGWFFRWPQMAS